MMVALNKRSKKIMLNNHWLPWLARDVITNFEKRRGNFTEIKSFKQKENDKMQL